ncbi:MAG: hypothetical protein IJ071_05315 [Ruminococcus sp.]|nr:hypothetical protein [Ruminococcus sp.]
MNKNTKLLATILFAAMIILAVAITRFYRNDSGEAGTRSGSADIAKILETGTDGTRIFQDSAGSCGMIDGSDRQIVAPEWQELRFAGEDRCIAAKRIGGDTLWGCINYEGDVCVPFIYSSMIRREVGGLELYTAQCAEDGSTVLYSSSFVPFSGRAWQSCALRSDELTLSSAAGDYIYYVSGGELLFKRATVNGSTMGRDYTVDIVSRVLLSKLTVPMIEKMTAGAGAYIEYAFTGDDEVLSRLTTGSRAGFSPLFPEDHKILSKELMGISNVYIYEKRSEDGRPHFLVTVTADTEIGYSDEAGQKKSLRGEYKAEIEYSGSESDLTAVSGAFAQEEPDYPLPEPPPEEQEGEEPGDPSSGELQDDISAQAADWSNEDV